MKRRDFLKYTGLSVSVLVSSQVLAQARPMTDVLALPTALGASSVLEERDLSVSKPFSYIIKVIGVGGCGLNTVEHMVREGVNGFDFIGIDTSIQALTKSSACTKLQLGSEGLGAGGNPEIARDLALIEREKIAAMLCDAHMVFITAGMGGGTGTGAAPVIAKVARDMGILTVAVVTKPFKFEGLRIPLAEQGLIELAQHVDSLIVVNNEKIIELLGDEVRMTEAISAIDEQIKNIVGDINSILSCSMVGVDLEDIRTVLVEKGRVMTASAEAHGIDRASFAAEKAIASPLQENSHLSGARGVLVSITASQSLGLPELRRVLDIIRAHTAADATIIYGADYDDKMEDRLRVSIVATGLG